ncbi:hypothetical protein E4U59_001807 [Claviceps monticola]|nr:hypothetical protein E4U59_001807 [Claviceps monticola]
MVLLVRRREAVKHSPYSLGKFGPIINIICVVWIMFALVIFCMPVTLPVDASSMNYASVVFAGFAAIAVAWYDTIFRSKYRCSNSGTFEQRPLFALIAALYQAQLSRIHPPTRPGTVVCTYMPMYTTPEADIRCVTPFLLLDSWESSARKYLAEIRSVEIRNFCFRADSTNPGIATRLLNTAMDATAASAEPGHCQLPLDQKDWNPKSAASDLIGSYMRHERSVW